MRPCEPGPPLGGSRARTRMRSARTVPRRAPGRDDDQSTRREDLAADGLTRLRGRLGCVSGGDGVGAVGDAPTAVRRSWSPDEPDQPGGHDNLPDLDVRFA